MAIQAIGLGTTANDGTGDPLRTAFSKINSNFSELSAQVINVKSYGAKGDGSTDDAAAINSAVSAAKTALSSGFGARVFFPYGNYVVNSSINLTGIQSKSFLIDGSGAVITGKCTGKPVLDALGSRWLRIRDINVVGDAVSTPSMGIQIGRAPSTAFACDNHYLDGVFISGYFSFACLYNFTGETSLFNHCFFWNQSTNVASYCLVQDGRNHFNAVSDFISNSAAADTAVSFNENCFVNCDFRALGGGIPIWLANTARHRFVSSYVASTVNTTAIVLYSSSNMLDLDLHIETTAVQDAFLVTGTNGAPSYSGFCYRDQQPFATRSIFKLDTGINAPTMHGCMLELGALQSGAVLFNEPSSWVVDGIISFVGTSSTGYNLPAANFSGMLNLSGAVSFKGGITADMT